MLRRQLTAALCASTMLLCPAPGDAGAQSTRRVTVFPSPGSQFASPRTQVSFRGVTSPRLGVVTVSGDRSGARTISLRNHSDGKGVSALLNRPFTPGELVTVNTSLNVRNARNGDFRFRVAQAGRPIPRAKVRELRDRRSQIQVFRSRPDLRPPRVRVTKRRRGVSGGHLFVTPKIGPGHNGPMILDNAGDVVWFHRVPAGLEANGLEVQRYRGQPVLTWWEGFLNFGVGNGVGKIFDTRYRRIAEIRANGYDGLDPHEIRLTERGTAVVAIQTLVYRDLSSIRGARRAQVFDAIVQEIDVPTGLVLYEWHSLDHVSVRESYTKPPKRDGHLYDYFHINSIEEDHRDGHFVLSGRNTWGVYKIDKYDGRVRWRLGGKRSSFRMGRGTKFAWQHDARVQRSGRITIFDNGAAPKVNRHSRGIAIRINARRRRAGLSKNYRHSSRLLSGSQGNMQRLPNGNVLIGWGQNPVWSEYSPRGRELYSARLTKGNMSYRAFRFPWSGLPATAPDLAATTNGRTTSLYASWNGATGVTGWQILGGPRPDALRLLRSVRRNGFETLARVGGSQPYVAVRAVSRGNRVLGTSKVIRPGAQTG